MQLTATSKAWPEEMVKSIRLTECLDCGLIYITVSETVDYSSAFQLPKQFFNKRNQIFYKI